MSDTTDRPPRRAPDDSAVEPARGQQGAFVTGLLLGAALGAGLALLFAPASGEETRRIIRRRVRRASRDAAEGWGAAREHGRRVLRDKKEALRRRIDEGLERLDNPGEG